MRAMFIDTACERESSLTKTRRPPSWGGPFCRMLVLLRGWRRCGRSGRSWLLGRNRRGRRGPGSGARRCWPWRRGDARLCVVGVNHWLGNVHSRAGPQYGTRLAGNINYHRQVIRFGILVEYFHQLGANALRKFVLLLLDIVLEVLVIALKNLLFVFDGLHPLATLIVAQLV